MNLVMNISQFDINNILFSESKKNIIMDGNFTKIIYSDNIVSLNSIYLKFPLVINSIDVIQNKIIMKFNAYTGENIEHIQSIIQIEQQILDYYKKMYNCNKISTTILKDQLYNGNIKLYKDPHENMDLILSKKYILKISGIWETNNVIGITYKIIEAK